MRRDRHRFGRSLGAFIVASLVSLYSSVALAQTPEASPSPAPSSRTSLLVKLAAGLSASEQQAVIARDGGTEVDSVPALRLHIVEVDDAAADQAIQNYQSDQQVQRVERDQTRDAEAVPSDPSYASQWGLAKIGWDSVYGTVTPSGTATIAVLDTGVESSTGDLGARLTGGFSAIEGASERADANGHGTWLASIAAAVTDNGAGIAGVAFDGVSVMPVKVLDDAGVGQDSDIIEGVVWAADHGADAILMGFSNPGFSPDLQDAVDYAWSRGAVLVAATGNDGSSAATYPAGDARVVGVSATDSADALWSGSNYGADTFIAAPGADVAADAPGSGTVSISGTSASAAFVAGAAALIRANDASASNGAVVGRLGRSADPAGTIDQTGNGRLNLARAMADTSNEEVAPTGAPGGGPFVGPYVAAALTVSATVDPAGPTINASVPPTTPASKKYQFSYTPPGGSPTFTPCKQGVGNSGALTDSFAIPSGSPTGDWTVRVDEYNNSTECKDDGTGLSKRTAGATASTTVTVGQGTISGTVINDLNGNGVDDAEAGLADASIALYLDNGNGIFDGSATDTQQGSSITTTSSGAFSFGSLVLNKTYFVIETNPTGFTSTASVAGSGANSTATVVTSDRIKVTLNTSASAVTNAGNKFLDQAQTASISGAVIDDINGNGVDNSDPGLDGATVSLWRDTNSNGTLETSGGTPDTQVGSSVITPSSGAWSFGSLAVGTYFVVEANPASYLSTNAIAGTGSNTTATNITNDQIKVLISAAGAGSSGNKFLDHTNHAPTAVDDSYSTNEDAVLSPTAAAGVLSNDGDVDGDALAAVLVSGPSHGGLTLNSDGSFTYTPAANYNGPDSFTYKAKDPSNVESNVATASITVNAVNDAPTCTNGSASTNEESTLTSSVSCSDIDSASLTYSVDTTTGQGTLALAGSTGSFSYDPGADYNGSDSFTFHAYDGQLSSNTALFSITVTEVNDPPVASADSATVAEDSGATAIGVVGNDSAGPSNEGSQTLTLDSITAGPSHGTAVVGTGSDANKAVYTPTANYNGTDSFTYKVCDNGTTNGAADHKCDTALVSITVTEVNDPPVASADSATVAEDGSVNVDVLGNDSAGPANESSQTLNTDSVTVAPAHGTAVVITSGPNSNQIGYTPAADYNGTDSFTYKVCDNGTTNGAADHKCDTAVVSITVTEVNDPPVASNDTGTVDEDDPIGILVNVLANDSAGPSNESGQTLTISNITAPSHGTATLESGKIRYIPTEANYNGPDSFTYKACDNGTTNGSADHKCSAAATVSITVNPVNDAPVLTLSSSSGGGQYSDPIDADPSTPAIDTITFSATDVDGDGITIGATGSPMSQNLALSAPAGGSGSVSRTLFGTLNVPAGPYTIAVTASDGVLTDSKNFAVTVTRENANIIEFEPDYVATDGADGDLDTMLIQMTIQEAQDGNLSNALNNAKPIAVTVTPVTPGSGPAVPTCTATNTSTAGLASCAINDVPPNVYQIDASIGGNYFTGGGTYATTVYDPSLGAATGGGWYQDANGYRVNYGFTVKWQKKNSTNARGSLLMIWHRPDGLRILKSNAMGSLVAGSVGSEPNKWWWGKFDGKATFQTPTRQSFPGCTNSYKCGNYAFSVYVEDRGEPGANVDKMWVQVTDPNGTPVGTPISMPSPYNSSNAAYIRGGNIQIPH